MACGHQLDIGESIAIDDLSDRMVMRVAVTGKLRLRVARIVWASMTVVAIPGVPHPLQLIRAEARCA